MCQSKVNSVKVSVNRTVNRIKEGEDKCLTAVLALKDGMDMASAFMGEGPWVLRELGLKQAFPSTFFFNGQEEFPHSHNENSISLRFLFSLN